MQFKISSNVSWRRIGREIIVLRTDSGEYYSLAEAGADAWEWLAKGIAIKAVAASLAKSYSIAMARADKDVAALASKLKKAGLLELSSSALSKAKAPRLPAPKFPYAKLQLTRYASLQQKSYAWATY